MLLVGAYNQKKVLAGAFSVIVKSNGSFAALILGWCTDLLERGEAALDVSRAYVCQESSPIGAFSSHRSWMKWYSSSDTPTLQSENI